MNAVGSSLPRNARPHKRRRKNYTLLLLAAIPMLLVVLFRYVPLFGWILSVLEYRVGTPILQSPFVGMKFFNMIFHGRDMGRVMINTVIFALISFAFLPLPMLLAILLNEIPGARFRKTAQTLTTLPYFIGWIITYSLAFAIWGGDGMVNQIKQLMGIRTSQLGILTDASAVYWFQGLLTLWKTIGWNAIIYIAAITGIDQELYEAARVDGAGRFKSALHITVPALMPTFIVLMLLNISNLVNLRMDQYFVFKNSFVYDRIEIIDLFAYRMGLQLQDFSFATAIGMFKSIISIVLLFSVNYIAKRTRGESIV